MKKGLLKIITSILFLGLIITLSSCDIHFENLFSSNSATSTKDGTEIVEKDDDKNKTTGDNSTSGTNTGNNQTDGNTSTNVEKTDEEELKIKDLILDYQHDYGYLKLGEIETYGEDLQTIYEEAFNQAKIVLTSANDYEKTTKTVNENGSTVEKQYYLLPEIKINNSNIKSSSSFTIKMAISAVMEMIYDNPLFYFLSPGYLNSSDTVYLMLIDEYATASARTVMNNSILSVVSDYKTNNNYTSDYQKINSVNKYIMKKLVYAKDGSGKPEDSYWAHNLEGFVNPIYNKGVCECYAKACSLLMKVVGVESILVTGTATSGGSTAGHAWNYVKIDNKWYGLDVTWNDNDLPDVNKGDYFLVGSNKMNTDHTPSSSSVYSSSFRVEAPTLSTTAYSII